MPSPDCHECNCAAMNNPPCAGCTECPDHDWLPDRLTVTPTDPLADKLREVKVVMSEANERVSGVAFGVSAFEMVDRLIEEFETTHLQLLRERQQHEAEVEDMAEQLWISHELQVRGDARYFPWVESFHRAKFRGMAERMLKQGFRREKDTQEEKA